MPTVDVTNVQVKPIKAYFGKSTYQVQKITCVADVSSSLNNKYFHIYTPAGTKYHVWYNVASGGSDPAPGGSTAAVVAISANATASSVASATQAVIDGLAEWTATVSGSVVTMTDVTAGYAVENHDAQGSSNQVGFSFDTYTLGDTELDLGLLDGTVEVSGFGAETKDITAHQYGPLVLSKVKVNPQAMQVKMTLKETTFANLKKLITAYGGSLVPVGASTTEVVGLGTNKQFKSVAGRKLRLHPVTNGSSDYSEDLTFWNAFPVIDNMTFSGEEFLSFPVTFDIFPDLTKQDRVNLFVYGDSSQTLTE